MTLRVHWPEQAARPTACSQSVLMYTDPASMQDPAGGEIQLLRTYAHLRKLGVNARLLDPWKDRIESADCLHLFGTLLQCLQMAKVARRLKTPVALSPISWYDPKVNWSIEPNWRRRIRGIVGWSARRAFPALPTWRRELIRSADLLLPNSEAEAAQLCRLFQVPRHRIHVVPNGVDPRFGKATPDLFYRKFQTKDFVLIPGRIEPRKNQLGVIRALWGSSADVVVLGDPHPDHLDYYRRCRDEAGETVRFLPRCDHADPMLESAYAAAKVLVLASWFETPGLVALEGGLAGCRIIVTEIGSAPEYFGDTAVYVRPTESARIRSEVLKALSLPADESLANRIRESFLWSHAAAKTAEAYGTLTVKPGIGDYLAAAA